MFFKRFFVGGNPPTKTHAPPTRKPRPRNSQIDKWSISEATNRTAEHLPAAAALARIFIGAAQVAGPGAVELELSRTPEESEGPNIGETTSEIAKTTWESGETA